MHLENVLARSMWSSGDLVWAFIAGLLILSGFISVDDPGSVASSSPLFHSATFYTIIFPVEPQDS